MSMQFSGKRLRELRRSAVPKLTQQQLADKLGICRETVVAIENEHPGSLKEIKAEVIVNWFSICQPKISDELNSSFSSYLKSFFKIS